MNGQAVPGAAAARRAGALRGGGDGARVFTGGGDKMAKVWDGDELRLQVARRRRSSRSSGAGDERIVTAGWDKTVQYWDGELTPKATLQLPERAYCMDVEYPVWSSARRTAR